jgi:phosphoribosylformylglycinamidine cyclo-ligase
MSNYKKAGVDVEAGYEGVKLIKKHVKRTTIPGVLSDIGGLIKNGEKYNGRKERY